MNYNTPALWDALWRDPSYRRDDLYRLERERLSIRWQRIEQAIEKQFGTFEGRHIIELGAGAGKIALLCALRGGHITLVDYSEKALDRAKTLFGNFGINVDLRLADVLHLPEDLLSKYDVSMSFGLTEHFLAGNRLQANKAHFEVLRPEGIAFIAVPNRHNPPYMVYKAVSEKLGTWKYGEEYPYSRSELVSICTELGIDNFSFFGDSFWDSFRFINPLHGLPKKLGRKPRRELGSPLDAYFSYSLVLQAKKPSSEA